MLQAFGRPLFAQALRRAAYFQATRALSSTPCRLSDHHEPMIFGKGSPAGAVPTDEDQATGIERLQLLGKMTGTEVFNMTPVEMTKPGTLDDPIPIPSLARMRIVGCTGFPSESHDVLWLKVHVGRKSRCKECGNVFKLDFQGDEHGDNNHH